LIRHLLSYEYTERRKEFGIIDIGVLRLISGTDRKKEKPDRRKLHNVALTLLAYSQIKFSDQNRNEGVITACGRQRKKR
jgi:hypothetical protein